MPHLTSDMQIIQPPESRCHRLVFAGETFARCRACGQTFDDALAYIESPCQLRLAFDDEMREEYDIRGGVRGKYYTVRSAQ